MNYMEDIMPIKPSEIVEKKLGAIPNEMIKAVNDCIVKHWNGNVASFKQEELLERYFEIIGEPNIASNREKLFEMRYLNFEPIFEKEGWDVEYQRPDDKPAYQNFPAQFIFTVKKRKK